MTNFCHLGDLIHAFYSGVKVRLLVLTHYGDARRGVRWGCKEILYQS